MKPQDERAQISQAGLLVAIDQAIGFLPRYDSEDWDTQPDNCKVDVNFCREYLERLRENISA